MKPHVLIFVIIMLVLSACGQAPTPVVQEPTAAPLPSDTPMPTATSTPLPPTNTPAPTETPLPTATFTPTATPVPEVISGANAAKLQLVRRYGDGMVLQTLWSPDAKQLLVLTTLEIKAFDPASGGGLLWEAETGSPQKEMAYTADGKSIVSLSKDGVVKIWDAATGELSKTALEARDGIDYSDLSASGNVVALANSAYDTALININTGETIKTFNGSAFPLGLTNVLVSPNDTNAWMVGWGSGEKHQVQFLDVQSDKFIFMLGIGWSYITDLMVSPDSTKIAGMSRLALTSEVENAFLVWSAASGKQISKTVFPMDVDAYAFVPGQEQAVVASDGVFSLVDVTKGEKLESFGSYTYPVTSMDVSSDGKLLSAVTSEGVITTYDLEKKAKSKEFQIELSLIAPYYRVSGVNYFVRSERNVGIGADPNGKFVAVLNPDRKAIDLIDPATLKVIKTVGKSLLERYITFSLSQDGALIAVVDEWNMLYLFDTASGTQKLVIDTRQQNFIKKVEIAPDNSTVATVSGGRLGELYLWDTKTGEKVKTLSGYNVMAYAPDGQRVVSDNTDFGVYVWDVASGKQLAAPSAEWIYDLTYAPDGGTVAISGFAVHGNKGKERENLITLLDTETNKMLPTRLLGHPAPITRVVYSPDGKILASADIHGNIRLWNAETAEMITQIREAVPAPLQMAFINEGRTLVVASLDGTLSFYEAR